MKPGALAHIAGEGDGLGDPCDALAAIYESMYGKVPKHMPAASLLRACAKMLGLPGDADWEERMAAVELFNGLRKQSVLGFERTRAIINKGHPNQSPFSFFSAHLSSQNANMCAVASTSPRLALQLPTASKPPDRPPGQQ